MDRVVEACRVEGHTYRNERIHLVVLLRDGVILCVLLKILRPRDVHENVAEHADRIRIPSHHHVAETDVVVGRKVRRHHACKHGFFVELKVIERFECETEVAQQTMYT